MGSLGAWAEPGQQSRGDELSAGLTRELAREREAVVALQQKLLNVGPPLGFLPWP